ncbi:ribonuclease 3-like protein 2 [Telopea speciosissima]|uniref:ribonuclease 3-like protein 2 n=1 Tax=Telopea speciosissima TaxID=54955 RepID=UPI001CC812D5|nr:ribonuclease 3-like protein 2 [Telopea speciosissima]
MAASYPCKGRQAGNILEIALEVLAIYVVMLVDSAISYVESLFLPICQVRLLTKMKAKMKMREGYEILALSYTVDIYDHLEDLLCYRFRDKTLLQEAFTHGSYTKSPSYERLEFLGDAALSLALAEYGFRSYPLLDSGKLTDLRKANDSNENLARVAVHHKLFRYVRHNVRSLHARVNKFALAVQDEDGVFTNCGSVKAPKILADIVESLTAAVYVDCNCDLKVLYEVFKRLMDPIITLETLDKQPRPATTMLFEFCHKQGKKVVIKSWRKEFKNFAFVYVDRKLIGYGSSEKTKIAKLEAAKEALQKLWKFDLSKTKTDQIGHGADEIERAKLELNELCREESWCEPKYRREGEIGPSHARKFICSVQVETADGEYFTIGDERSRVKYAENSAASMMLQGLPDSEYGIG